MNARLVPGVPHPRNGRERGGLVYRRATTPQDLEKVFRLRYRVYVVERGFERPEDHPGGIEQDEFDAVAVHFLCEGPDGSPVGTVRLILPSPFGYPLEQHCALSIDPAALPRDRLAEVSRLAITRQYQRRRADPFHPAAAPEGGGGDPSRLWDRRGAGAGPPPGGVERRGGRDRRRAHVVLGLYRGVYRATKRLGITHWYAAMEDKLWILLRRLGFLFEPIGPFVEYHGRRAPFLAEVAAVERAVYQRAPDIYRDFRKGLGLDPAPGGWRRPAPARGERPPEAA